MFLLHLVIITFIKFVATVCKSNVCNILQSVFIKDSNSLGFYDATSATVVQLDLKERGGHKK